MKNKKDRNYTHTNEIRFFQGIHPVKELPKEDWEYCKFIYPNATRSLRGYIDLNGHWGKVGDKIRLPTGLVWPRKRESLKKE